MKLENITRDFARRDDCLDHMVPSDLRRLLSKIYGLEQDAKDLVAYPREAFLKLIAEGSPYAFYIFQWVPYQTDAMQWRLKMLHDVKTFDGREEFGIWPNGNSCGSFKDEEVEFIRISKEQFGYEYVDPRGKDEKILALTEPLHEPLPEWAIGEAKGELALGAQLCTRDGRSMGNAYIIEVLENPHKNRQGVHNEEYIYCVVTDAGTRLRLYPLEIAEIFYPPAYVGLVKEILRKFGTPAEERDYDRPTNS